MINTTFDYGVHFYDLLVITLLLFLSALISGSEAAFFSLNERKLEEKSVYPFTLVKRLIKDREALLTTLLVMNEVVNITLSAYIANVCMDISGSIGAGYAGFISFFAILYFGEFFPKALGVRYNYFWTITVSPFIFVLVYITYPLRIFLYFVSKLVSSLVGEEEERMDLIVKHATESGVLEADEGEMIKEALAFSELTAKDVMVPEPYIFMVPLDVTIEELKELVKINCYSKIPVYEGTRDNIIGYVKISDIVGALYGLKDFDLRKVLRPVHFVPETRLIGDLIEDFKNLGLELVIVVDEYGSITGLLTLEDIMEEVVGDIPAEHEEEKEYVRKIDDGTFVVGGLTKIEDLSKHVELPEDLPDVDTVGGLVLHLFGRIPRVGSEVGLGNLRFIVSKMEGKRIKEILVNIVEKEEDEVLRY